MKPVWNDKAKAKDKALAVSSSILFDFQKFDCVRLAKRLGEVDYVRLPNPIQINRTIEVRLSSITERLIDYVGLFDQFTLLSVGRGST